MPYEATCPKGHRLQVTEGHFGQRVNCPTCGEAFVVPELGKAAASSTPPSQSAGKAGLDTRRWKPSLEMVSGLSQGGLWAGRPLVAVGLVLVLLVRGCDGVGQRGVQRAEGKVQAARDELADSYQTKRLQLEEKISERQDNSDPKAEDDPKLTDLKTQLADLAAREAKDRKKCERGAWRGLEINARTAKTNQQINAYWREIFFVFASILLAIGLLLVSWTAQGAERWLALGMLAILTASVFIGGAAWVPLPR
jgi:hypothetical protein